MATRTVHDRIVGQPEQVANALATQQRLGLLASVGQPRRHVDGRVEVAVVRRVEVAIAPAPTGHPVWPVSVASPKRVGAALATVTALGAAGYGTAVAGWPAALVILGATGVAVFTRSKEK